MTCNKISFFFKERVFFLLPAGWLSQQLRDSKQQPAAPLTFGAAAAAEVWRVNPRADWSERISCDGEWEADGRWLQASGKVLSQKVHELLNPSRAALPVFLHSAERDFWP